MWEPIVQEGLLPMGSAAKMVSSGRYVPHASIEADNIKVRMGFGRVRCRFVRPPIRSTPASLEDSAPLFLKRRRGLALS